MAIVAKNSLVLSPATPASSLLAAKHPPAPPMNQADPDPANADSSDVSVEAPSAGTGGTAAPTTRSLSKVSSAGASANEDAGNDENDTPRSTASSNPPARQRKYERKTKRFIWPEELHRLFVAAIFDVGLKNASPKALLALMGAAGPGAGLTTEHLKSHLQKYRLNYERSRQEFLDFYDQSAKKNLKRRRKQASRTGEHNTMFVFPIVPNPKKNNHDSDDDSDGDADESMSMSDSTQSEQPTPRDSGSKDRTDSFSQLLERAERVKSHRGRSQSQQQYQTDERVADASASERVRYGAPSHEMAAQALQSFGVTPASSAQKQSMTGVDASNLAALPFRYPPGMAAVGSASGMPPIMDPQWSILNSMMSPQLSGMVGNVASQQQLPLATSEAMGGAGGDAFALGMNEEPTDLQFQMHLAMQAHMNLHRQMLTRKVEVSQHAVGANSVSNSYAQQAWGNRVMAQQQQQQQQQQQRQYQQNPQPQLAPIPEQQLSRTSVSLQTRAPENQQMHLNILPRPSLGSGGGMAAEVGMVGANGSTSSASIDEVMAEDPGVPPSANLDGRTDDDSLDLYRWDRIDLNVDLDDDDLFGFLKS